MYDRVQVNYRAARNQIKINFKSLVVVSYLFFCQVCCFTGERNQKELDQMGWVFSHAFLRTLTGIMGRESCEENSFGKECARSHLAHQIVPNIGHTSVYRDIS